MDKSKIAVWILIVILIMGMIATYSAYYFAR